MNPTRYIDRVRNRRAFIFFVFPFIIILLLPVVSLSQDYSFSVPKNYSDIYINRDGSITIIYQITFKNDADAGPIDIVDIGLPNYHYDLSSAVASIDDTPLYLIYRSSYIHTGVEVHLLENKIMPGQTKTLKIEIVNPHMIYKDDEMENYASMEFSPTWFNSSFTHDKTDLSVSIHLPKGIGIGEAKYHYREYDGFGYDYGGRMVYRWRNMSAGPSKKYKFGVSFPDEYVETVFEEYHEPFFISFISIIYRIVTTKFPYIIILVFLFMVLCAIYQTNRRRLKFYPPAVSIEGVGIKRGLKAPEAAILLDLPLQRVVTMILFGLLKKGIVRVEENGGPGVFEIKGSDKSNLSDYERGFLNSLKPDGRIDSSRLRKIMIVMIRSVNKKIKGFSRGETIEYYRGVVKKAFEYVTAANTPGLLGKEWDENAQWMLMDKDYRVKIKETLSGREVKASPWYENYLGLYQTNGGSKEGASLKIGDGGTLLGADLANNFIMGVENFSNKFVSNVESFTENVKKITNPPLKIRRSGISSKRPSSRKSFSHIKKSRSKSISGGACACAGCACACAGGGR
jgi:hypothetical protein